MLATEVTAPRTSEESCATSREKLRGLLSGLDKVRGDRLPHQSPFSSPHNKGVLAQYPCLALHAFMMTGTHFACLAPLPLNCFRGIHR